MTNEMVRAAMSDNSLANAKAQLSDLVERVLPTVTPQSGQTRAACGMALERGDAATADNPHRSDRYLLAIDSKPVAWTAPHGQAIDLLAN